MVCINALGHARTRDILYSCYRTVWKVEICYALKQCLCIFRVISHFRREMNKVSMWLLRIFLFLAILFSGLEKTCSYVILDCCYALETNPFPRVITQTAGLLNGHLVGFILSVVLMYFMYKISIEMDRPLTLSVGVFILALASCMYFSVFLHNLRNLQMLDAYMHACN
jgi:hypothetical protein